jgi:hypothetical protein
MDFQDQPANQIVPLVTQEQKGFLVIIALRRQQLLFDTVDLAP